MKLKELGIVLAVFVIGLAIGGMFVKIQYLESTNNKAPSALGSGGPQQPTQPPAAPAKVDVKVTADDPIKGNPNAKLTIVEFSDFQCPFCENFFKNVEPQILKDYVDTGKAKFVYKQLPLVSLHQNALLAANASLCAKEQNKFWEYHDKLFEAQGSGGADALLVNNLKKYATDLRLDQAKFDGCLDSKKYDPQVQADITEASKNNINGTPYTVVGSTGISGAQPYAQFKTAIDAELAKVK